MYSGGAMPKTVTLRLPNEHYEMFKRYADSDNRSLSNFIETAAMRYIEEIEYVDEFEMAEIRSNKSLNASLKRGIQDTKKGRGQFV
jgi:predicted DNA-binding protein